MLLKKFQGGGVEQIQKLTWGELDDFSDRLAQMLVERLRTKTPVLIYGHKDPYMLVCFLACAKAGRAYCPIDVSVPQSRVEAILEEVRPELLLATEPLAVNFSDIVHKEEIVRQIAEQKDKVGQQYALSAEDVYYIIFTSGSTGKPKGVQITRDCLDHFIAWGITLGKVYADKPAVFLNQAPFSFDLSVMDLYLCLYTGGTLWALTREVQQDMRRLMASLERSGANVWVSTPSFADVCLSDQKFSHRRMTGIETFLFCGETLSNQTAGRLAERFPNAEIVNTYGPTESTVAVTEVKVTPEVNRRWSPLPVGKEKEGTWIEIIDANGKVLTEGEKGEIVIVGDTVSIGYWNNETLNQKVFGQRRIKGKDYRFYRTGDEGYKKEGYLFYCGRIDLQIKLHGYRIEVEDIENNILKLDDVKQAVVIPNYRGGKVSSLTGYVVLAQCTEDEFAEGQKIKEQLKQYLPDYMVPKKIKFMPRLPRTDNGKIDRKALAQS